MSESHVVNIALYHLLNLLKNRLYELPEKVTKRY